MAEQITACPKCGAAIEATGKRDLTHVVLDARGVVVDYSTDHGYVPLAFDEFDVYCADDCGWRGEVPPPE